MAIKKETIHGFSTLFDESSRNGVHYLRDNLQLKEAKTFYDAARLTGSAEFEDNSNHDWTLLYNRGESNYTLLSRKRS